MFFVQLLLLKGLVVFIFKDLGCFVLECRGRNVNVINVSV